MAQTVDELTEQMRKSVAGEKDFHDLVVEQVTRQTEENKRVDEERRRQLFEEAEARAPVVDAPPSRGFTLEEVNARAARTRQIAAQAAASFNMPMSEEDEKRMNLAERFLGMTSSSEPLMDDSPVEVAHTPLRPRDVPFGRR
jgi:hypothetical protein